MRLQYQTRSVRGCQAELRTADGSRVWVVAAPRYAKTNGTNPFSPAHPETFGVTVPPVRCTCGKLLQPPPTGGFRCPFCAQTFEAVVTPEAVPAVAPELVSEAGSEAVMEPPPVMDPEPEVPQPIAELEELASRHVERDSGTPIVRMLLWLMMGVFLTVPLIFMGVYVKNELRRMDQKRQKVARTVEVKKAEPEIPDNIDWQHPDWGKFGEWSGTGAVSAKASAGADKLIPITIVRSRIKFVMEVSPSRGAKRPETANFRLINVDDTGIQSLIGGMRAPGRSESDSYEYRRKKGWPPGTYNLQVEVQGNPTWRVMGLEDLQFPEAPASKVTPGKK
jgi:hypothetical protein